MRKLLLAAVASGSLAGAAYAGGCPQPAQGLPQGLQANQAQQAQGIPQGLQAQQAQGLPQAQQAQQAQGIPQGLQAQQAQGSPVTSQNNTQVAAADCPR
jgi:hypothetical protein